MSAVFYVNFCCYRCKAWLGEFDQDESLVLLSRGMEKVLCFDCDGPHCDLWPDSYYDVEPGDILGFSSADGTPGLEFEFFPNPPIARVYTYMSARAPGLSSSTYLNTTTKNQAHGLTKEVTTPYLILPYWVIGGVGS